MVPNPEAQKVLDLAKDFGVEVSFLPPEADFSSHWQKKMEREHNAFRCPAPWLCYASFGNPETGKRGQLFVPSEVHVGHWQESEAFICPEIILLHELAHCVVGAEEYTIPWEQGQCVRLWGEGSEQWKNLGFYEDGAADANEVLFAAYRLRELGLI